MPRGRGRGRSAIARRRCPVHSYYLGSDGVCSRCQESERVQQQQQDDAEQDVAAVNVPIPPDSPNDVQMTESCAKCCRTSTERYNLNFQTLHRDSLHRTMFGKPVAEMTGETITMCQLCTDYNNNINRHKDWANAWPSVMYTFLFDTHRFNSNAEKLYKLLPNELKESYKQNMNTVHPSLATTITESVFRDITHEKEDFWTLINTKTAKTLVKALTVHCFPNIRCPAGCFEFVEKSSGISFAHFLNWLYPTFTSFNANSKKFLKGARKDFLKPLTLLEKFNVSPCVITNEKGLQLVTCSDHKNGVLLNYVHIPTNPVAGNISPRNVDRLALMVSSVRTVRPLKIGVKSATFTMCRVDSGRISGVSSTVLHKFRNFEPPYPDLHQDIERLMINCRSDVKEIIRTCCQNQEISARLAEEFLTFEAPVSFSLIEEHCKNAVVFNMRSLMDMKDYVETCPDDVTLRDDFKKPLVYGHKLDSYGSEPSVFPKGFSQEGSLFVFSHALLITDSLWSKLCRLCDENVNISEICKILNRLNASKNLRHNYANSSFINGLQNAFNELFPTQIEPLVALCDSLEGCQVVTCARGAVDNISIDCNRNDVLLVVATESQSRDTQIPFNLTSANGKDFQLIFLSSDGKVSVRHGDPFFNFWTIINDGSRAVKDPTLEFQYNRTWKFLIYVSKSDFNEETKLRYLKYMGGQGIFFCSEHNLPLSTDYFKSNRKCNMPKNTGNQQICTRKSAWRCPEKDCFASVCKTHFREYSDTVDKVLVDNTPSNEAILDSSDDEPTLEEEAEQQPDDNLPGPSFVLEQPQRTETPEEANMDEFDCPQLIVDAGFQETDAFATDSGCEPVYLSNDSKFVPMHVLLNGECQLLKRLRYPKHVGKKFQRFFQNFISTLPGRSIPLLQPEACLFPSIFFKQLEDCSFPGALPFFLYDDRNANSKFDFDGLHEHMRLRLKDSTLLTSSNLGYIMYAFDSVLNLSLTKCHTNQLFKRGLQTITIGKYKPQQLTSTESVLKMDSVDSDVHVNRLGTACASETPDLFVTFTCNQKEHPGVAEVVQAIYELYGSATTAELKEVLQAYMVIIVRCWTRTIELLLNCLRFSDEHILGEILKVWGRAEFQSAAANLQHYHILFWLKNVDEDVIDKIVCAQKHVLAEFKQLFHANFGTVDSAEHAGKLFDDCVRVQTHDCEKGHCMKKVRFNGERKCRFPPYPQSHVPWYKEFHQPHSEEALEALQEIQLAEPRPGVYDCLQVTSTLKAGKYMYAATSGEHMSPLNVALWSICKSSLNVLKVCKSVASRYLTSYAAGKEEHVEVAINPDNAHNVLDVKVLKTENKKLAGVRKILARQKLEEKNQGLIDSTTIASTECVSWMLQLPTVLTTLDFVSVPTVALENRGGVILKRKNNTQSRSNVPGVANEGPAEIRQHHLNFPSHRLFTRGQKIVLESVNKTPFSTDKVTVFSLRPPELLFVNTLKLYYRWFKREKLAGKRETVNVRFLKSDVRESTWVDGESYAIRLRPCAVTEFSCFVQDCLSRRPSDNSLLDASLVVSEVLNVAAHPNRSNFVSADPNLSNTPAEVVFSKVYPRNPANFLIHFLLSNAQFETELELFDVPTLKDAYVKGGIVPDKQTYDENDVNEILKKYVLEQLRYLPGGTRSFDSNLLAAKSAFKGMLIDNDIYNEGLPITTMDTLTEALEEKAKKMLRQSQVNIIKSLTQKNLPNFPSSNDFETVTKETPSNWSADLIANVFQSAESLQEQSQILETLKNLIVESLFSGHRFNRHQLILGPPGTGKTYVLTMALGYALSKGLFCLVTSLASRRSMHFGGEHIHKLFCLPPSSSGSPIKMAEQALNKLDHRNEKKMLLLALEVLFVEEVSLISAEQWSAMDIVLQELKQTTLPFGGVLVIASGDQMQLPSIEGNDIFLSPVLLTNFALFFLGHFVRMTDEAGQTVLRHMWRRPIDAPAVAEILAILEAKCTFKENWADLDDPCVMRVFGKRKAEQKEFESHIQRVRESGTAFRIFEATDEICLSKSSVWNQTDSRQVGNHLSDKVNEPKHLIVYSKALVRVTVNMESEQLSQGQVGVVHEVPTGDSVTVFIPDTSGGDVDITQAMLDHEDYLNWRSVTLSKQTGFVQSFKKNSVRRIQIPLMNNVAMTTHKLMGDTFDKLATSISATDSSYALWMTSQVFVIVSRVKQLKNLTFVGDKPATLGAIKSIFENRDLREERLFSLLDKIRTNSRLGGIVQPINISEMAFVPFNKNIPRTPGGFVYLLVSLNPASPECFYVGQTERALLTRLSEHNSGNGSNFTKPSHRLPWAVAGFVCNFASMFSRRDFESAIHNEMFERRDRLKTLKDMFALIQDLVNDKNCGLHFCVCGEFRST